MTKLESLQDIKDTAIRLQETLLGVYSGASRHPIPIHSAT
jgi:hypothetical protein